MEESKPDFDEGGGNDSGGEVAGDETCGACDLASVLGFCEGRRREGRDREPSETGVGVCSAIVLYMAAAATSQLGRSFLGKLRLADHIHHQWNGG